MNLSLSEAAKLHRLLHLGLPLHWQVRCHSSRLGPAHGCGARMSCLGRLVDTEDFERVHWLIESVMSVHVEHHVSLILPDAAIVYEIGDPVRVETELNALVSQLTLGLLVENVELCGSRLFD